jgi:multidrug efflux pump subunit AcrA (membrane-fusion protein)
MDGPSERQTGGTRGGSGRYTRTQKTAERDAEALRLRSRGLSYRAVSAEMGYASSDSAYKAVQRALKATVAEPAAEVRQLELDRLDRMYAAVVAVLERKHVTVSQGRVVRTGRPFVNGDGQAEIAEGQGEPLEDDAPVLAAVDRLLKIQARRAALLGLDSPVRQEVAHDGGLRYEIVGVDLADITGIPPE